MTLIGEERETTDNADEEKRRRKRVGERERRVLAWRADESRRNSSLGE
jgi:hypothetical protein